MPRFFSFLIRFKYATIERARLSSGRIELFFEMVEDFVERECSKVNETRLRFFFLHTSEIPLAQRRYILFHICPICDLINSQCESFSFLITFVVIAVPRIYIYTCRIDVSEMNVNILHRVPRIFDV